MEEFFLAEFFGEIFWEDFFWEDFLGGLFGGFFGRKVFYMEGINLFVKILIFVKILSQGRRKEEFQSFEERAQAHRS